MDDELLGFTDGGPLMPEDGLLGLTWEMDAHDLLSRLDAGAGVLEAVDDSPRLPGAYRLIMRQLPQGNWRGS